MRFQEILFPLLFICVLSATSEKSPVLDEYVEQLLEHQSAGELLLVVDEFRNELSRDENGDLLRKILDHPELRALLYGNYDAAPDRYTDLVLSRMLSDDARWTPGSGLYRSPSGGMVVAIVNRFSPDGLNGQMPPEALPMVLEDRAGRLEIAKVLEGIVENEGLSELGVIDRRRLAWEQIVRIVNSYYDRLVEEKVDEQRRSKSSAIDQPWATDQERRSRGDPGHSIHDHEVVSSPIKRTSAGRAPLIYLIASLALLAIAAASLYRSNARRVKR